LRRLKAVILVGGPGTRLQPLTNDIPKSIVPVLNRPVMEHMIAYLKQFEVEDIILTLSYLPDMIQSHFGDGRDFGVSLVYCTEKEPMGTAGAVKNAAEYLESTFIVLNGDIFTEMNLADMISFHSGNKAQATIALTWVDNPSAFGVVETDDAYRVKRFVEKPPPGEETTNWINAGAYILEPEVLEHIPVNQHYMFEKGLFPHLVDTGEPVYGYPYRGYWLDMGTLENYHTLNIDFLLSKVHSPLLPDFSRDGIYCGPDVALNPLAVITAPVTIERGCRIGREVRITGPVSIGRDCVLEDGASIEKAVLWDSIRVGAGARLSNCIVSSTTAIARGQAINDCAVTPSETVPLKRS